MSPSLSVSPITLQQLQMPLPNGDRCFDFLIYPFWNECNAGNANYGSLGGNERMWTSRSSCSKQSCPFISSHTHMQQKYFALWWEYQRLATKVKGPIGAESFLIMYKDICLSGRAYIIKTPAKANSSERSLSLSALLPFLVTPLFLPSLSPPPFSQQLICLFCRTWKTKQVIHPSPLFLRLCSRGLRQTSPLRYKIQYLGLVLRKHKSTRAQWSDGTMSGRFYNRCEGAHVCAW